MADTDEEDMLPGLAWDPFFPVLDDEQPNAFQLPATTRFEDDAVVTECMSSPLSVKTSDDSFYTCDRRSFGDRSDDENDEACAVQTSPELRIDIDMNKLLKRRGKLCHGKMTSGISSDIKSEGSEETIGKISIYSPKKNDVSANVSVTLDKLAYCDSWLESQGKCRSNSLEKIRSSPNRPDVCNRCLQNKAVRRSSEESIDAFLSCVPSETEEWEFQSISDSTAPTASQSAEQLAVKTDAHNASYQYLISSVSEPNLISPAKEEFVKKAKHIAHCNELILKVFARTLVHSAMARAQEEYKKQIKSAERLGLARRFTEHELRDMVMCWTQKQADSCNEDYTTYVSEPNTDKSKVHSSRKQPHTTEEYVSTGKCYAGDAVPAESMKHGYVNEPELFTSPRQVETVTYESEQLIVKTTDTTSSVWGNKPEIYAAGRSLPDELRQKNILSEGESSGRCKSETIHYHAKGESRDGEKRGISTKVKSANNVHLLRPNKRNVSNITNNGINNVKGDGEKLLSKRANHEQCKPDFADLLEGWQTSSQETPGENLAMQHETNTKTQAHSQKTTIAHDAASKLPVRVSPNGKQPQKTEKRVSTTSPKQDTTHDTYESGQVQSSPGTAENKLAIQNKSDIKTQLPYPKTRVVPETASKLPVPVSPNKTRNAIPASEKEPKKTEEYISTGKCNPSDTVSRDSGKDGHVTDLEVLASPKLETTLTGNAEACEHMLGVKNNNDIKTQAPFQKTRIARDTVSKLPIPVSPNKKQPQKTEKYVSPVKPNLDDTVSKECMEQGHLNELDVFASPKQDTTLTYASGQEHCKAGIQACLTSNQEVAVPKLGVQNNECTQVKAPYSRTPSPLPTVNKLPLPVSPNRHRDSGSACNKPAQLDMNLSAADSVGTDAINLASVFHAGSLPVHQEQFHIQDSNYAGSKTDSESRVNQISGANVSSMVSKDLIYSTQQSSQENNTQSSGYFASEDIEGFLPTKVSVDFHKEHRQAKGIFPYTSQSAPTSPRSQTISMSKMDYVKQRHTENDATMATPGERHRSDTFYHQPKSKHAISPDGKVNPVSLTPMLISDPKPKDHQNQNDSMNDSPLYNRLDTSAKIPVLSVTQTFSRQERPSAKTTRPTGVRQQTHSSHLHCQQTTARFYDYSLKHSPKGSAARGEKKRHDTTTNHKLPASSGSKRARRPVSLDPLTENRERISPRSFQANPENIAKETRVSPARKSPRSGYVAKIAGKFEDK